MLQRFCCPWFALLIFPLLFSCRKAVPEDISLPYAKKKYTPEMLADSTGASDSAAAFLHPFLWLESPLFEEELLLWKEKQYKASDRYLDMLAYRGKGNLSKAIKWENLRIVADSPLSHKTIPVCLPLQKDTMPLHLFYRENAFENGLNPTVLMPYDKELHAYLPPPESFFEEGVILAVLGEPIHTVTRDSSRFFAIADSLARRIWRDTAQIALNRRIYRNFIHDSLMAERYTTVSEKDVVPNFETEHLIMAANLLVASMYTTPSKMALLAIENGNSVAEQTLGERSDLFRAAVFDIRLDSTEHKRETSFCPDAENTTAVLMNDVPNRRAALTFMQDRMLRKTGQFPFLAVPSLQAEAAWRFILYHIAQEEGIVEVNRP